MGIKVTRELECGLRRETWSFQVEWDHHDGPCFYVSNYLMEKRNSKRHSWKDAHGGERVEKRPHVDPPREIIVRFRQMLEERPIFASRGERDRDQSVWPKDEFRHGRTVG
jgi:hypothetical protein